MLRLAATAAAALREHCRAGYPLEVCGFLVGVAAPDGRECGAAWPVANAWEADPALRAELIAGLASAGSADADAWDGHGAERRFLVSPADTVAAMRRAREAGLDLIGVYHSHPNHPAVPSAFDRDAAWPEWSYVIVSVREEGVTEVRSWVVETDEDPFVEELIAEEG